MKHHGGRHQITAAAWHYHPVAIFMHWLLAGLIAGMIGLGCYMTSIEDEPGSGWFFNLHKSIGLTVAALVLLRAAWRLAHAPAALPTSIPDWQVRAARVSHGLLYASLLLMPLTGFLGASRTQEGLVIFGIALPRFAVADHEMAERFFAIHGTVAWMLVALVMIHIAAALRHLLLKDGVFQRMWP